MDYKKKYEEALERAKGMYEQGMMPERIEYIFPELKESEDEKIRKELIKGIERCSEENILFNKEVSKSKVLAWLEKQGEQKPAEWNEEDKDNIFNIVGALDVLIQREIEKQHNGDRNASPKYYSDLQDCLKSLRPQSIWKPSEDQLYALDYVLNYHAFGDTNIRKKVQSLYDDLKKL